MKKIIILLLSLLSYQATFAQKNKVKISKEITKDDDATSVFVIGDWGRKGEFYQQKLANTMGKVAERIEPEFIISTGDNLYPNGVASVQDPQWMSSFENVYSSFALNCPWYVVLGNHDYRGNIQAEIEYTNISRRWEMPSHYFSKEIELEDGSRALFVYLDTNPLNDEYYEEEKYKDKVASQDTTKQLQWLDQTLANSTADWKIVTGHHPMYTGGKRADEPNYIKNHLDHIFAKHQVDLYLAGHEHDLQLIKPEGHTYHIVSGAGSEIRTTGRMEHTVFAESIQGFAMLEMKKEAIMLSFINHKGEKNFSQIIRK